VLPALALAASVSTAPVWSAKVAMAAVGPSASALATDVQNQAELTVLRLNQRKDVRVAQAALREQLLRDPIAQSADARARVDHAVLMWSNALALREIAGDTDRPRILWAIEPQARYWLDHGFAGAAWSGENPDHIYRVAFMDGRSRYEIVGRRLKHLSTQYSFSIKSQTPGEYTKMIAGAGDIPQFAMVQDKDIRVGADGRFRLTLDSTPTAGRINHIQIPQGTSLVLIRDSLADWRENANALKISRISGPPVTQVPLTDDQLAARIVRDLPGWAAYWAAFVHAYMNKPAPNTIVGPYSRDAGWGSVASGYFRLAHDQAWVFTLDPARAAYFSVQTTDP
jgi:hypothetical protein